MQRLRSLHLYLGCIFAPMLLFFAMSGIWQTLGIGKTGWLNTLSTLHTAKHLKAGVSLTSPAITVFVLAMAAGFMVTTVLGVVMAVKFGRNRRSAYWCLAFGVVFPLALVLLRAFQ
jgi:hypothetical protein